MGWFGPRGVASIVFGITRPQETEPEELKENEPVTAQQGLSQ
jgi:hypothetical protein